MHLLLRASAVCVIVSSASALAAAPPPSAKKASLDEFKALADGKTVTVEIFDLGKPITATLVWDWKSKSITGTAVVDKKDEIKVNSVLSFEGDKACSTNDGSTTCHVIYIEGNKFYEVRDDGEVHAVSTVK